MLRRKRHCQKYVRPVDTLRANVFLEATLALAYLLFVFMCKSGPQLFFLLFTQGCLENGSLVL